MKIMVTKKFLPKVIFVWPSFLFDLINKYYLYLCCMHTAKILCFFRKICTHSNKYLYNIHQYSCTECRNWTLDRKARNTVTIMLWGHFCEKVNAENDARWFSICAFLTNHWPFFMNIFYLKGKNNFLINFRHFCHDFL